MFSITIVKISNKTLKIAQTIVTHVDIMTSKLCLKCSVIKHRVYNSRFKIAIRDFVATIHFETNFRFSFVFGSIIQWFPKLIELQPI